MSTTMIRPHDVRTDTDHRALVAQLTLAAEWHHLDGDGRPDPAEAAAQVLGLDGAAAARLRRHVQPALSAAAALGWSEQVAVALHIALDAESAVATAA